VPDSLVLLVWVAVISMALWMAGCALAQRYYELRVFRARARRDQAEAQRDEVQAIVDTQRLLAESRDRGGTTSRGAGIAARQIAPRAAR
jgi:uncharacterized lipoprotein YmbA